MLKKILSLVSLSLVIICLITYLPCEAKQEKQIKKENKMEQTLLARFSEFSTESAFVNIKVKNEATGEEVVFVMDNGNWQYLFMYYVKACEAKDYPMYMAKHANDTFTLPEIAFNRNKICIADDSMKAIENNIEELKKYIAGAGPSKNSYYVNVPPKQMKSFIRYANGFEKIVVRQSCLDGRIYIQEI